MYLGGIISGMDTQTVIRQLTQLQRQPIVRLEQRAIDAQKRINAWTNISTKLSSLRTAVDDLKAPDAFDNFVKATSSNEAVGVTVTGTPASSATSFTVNQLATRHQMLSDDATPFTSADETVGAGTFSVTVDGTTTDFATTTSTTISELAQSINNAGIGVRASVLKVADGDFRLQLTSDDTGAGSAFTAGGDQAKLATFDTVQAGQDAQLTIGSGAGAVTVSRSSNTVTDLIDGLTLSLTATTTGPVDITVNRDVDGAVEKVKAFVDAANGALASIASFTDYDPETKKASTLTGDPTARGISSRVTQSILDEVAGLADGFDWAGAAGLSVDRDGQLTLDEAALRTALTDNWDDTSALFSRSLSSTDPDIALTYASDSAVAGTYAVEITQAASRATVAGTPYTVEAGDVTFDVTNSSGTTATVTVTGGSSLDDAIAQINTQLADQGISTISAEKNTAGDSLVLTESRYGSTRDFTVAGAAIWGLDGTFAGTDVAGTVNGVAATGTGQSLTVDDASTGKMTLKVTTSAQEIADAGGVVNANITYSTGIAGRTSSYLATTEGSDGSIAQAKDRWERQIGLFDDQIEIYEDRVARYEEQLKRRFAAMETMLAQLNSQSAWMASQMSPPQQQ